MANLLEISELAWRQLNPNPSNLPTIKKEEFIATARSEYAYQTLLKYYLEKRNEGYSEIPSILLDEEEFDVVNDEIDLSKQRVMRGLPNDMWLQNIGGLLCECEYVKSSVNLTQLIDEDDCLSDNSKTYVLVGQKIIFPKGTHKSKLKVIFAGAGKRVDDRIEVDDYIGGILRGRLIEIYGGKTGKEDITNNGDPNS